MRETKRSHNFNINIEDQRFSSYENTYSTLQRNDYETLDKLVKNYFEIDSLGVRGSSRESSKHSHAIDILEKTCRRFNNAWEIGLLWKDKSAPQVDSRATALKDYLHSKRN